MGYPGYYIFNAALAITLFGASTGTIVSVSALHYS